MKYKSQFWPIWLILWSKVTNIKALNPLTSGDDNLSREKGSKDYLKDIWIVD